MVDAVVNGKDSGRLCFFVINLASASGRRRLMEAQIQQAGALSFKFIAAVDGRSLSPEQVGELYDHVAARVTSGRDLSPAEIGCALSHRIAWRAIIESDLVAGGVLEDDALLGATSIDIIQRVLPFLHSPQPRLVLLQHVPRYSAWQGIKVSRIHRLYRPTRTRGAHAYALNAAAARKLLEITERISAVADDWAYFARQVELRAVVPYCVGRSPSSHESQIGPAGRREGKGSYRQWLRTRLYDKLLYQIVVRPLRRIRVQQESW